MQSFAYLQRVFADRIDSAFMTYVQKFEDKQIIQGNQLGRTSNT